jgi:hypothetical protein
MWGKIKRYQETIGFISAVIVLLFGLSILIVNPQSVQFLDIPFFIIYPGWILYSLNKKNYFSRK